MTKQKKKIIHSQARREFNKFALTFKAKKPEWFVILEDGTILEAWDFKPIINNPMMRLFDNCTYHDGPLNYHSDIGSYSEWCVTSDPLLLTFKVGNTLYKVTV